MGGVNRKREHVPAPVLIYTQWSEGTQRVYTEKSCWIGAWKFL